MIKILAVALTLLLTACAPATRRVDVDQGALDKEARFQRGLAVTGVVNDQTRLYRVSYPLLKAAAPMCKDKVRNGIGVMAINRHMLGTLSEVADTVGIGDEFKVVVVVADSPVAAAGIQVNDVLVSINDWKPATDKDSIKLFPEKINELLKPGTPLQVVVKRGDALVNATVTPETVCTYPVQMSNDTIINAFADGEKVVIARGMMRFATSDEELSLVISHEISHNAMGHLTAQRGNRIIGAIMDGILAGLTRTQSTGAFTNAMGASFSQDFEAEADYVGLYVMARANEPIKEAPKFWRRMAAESPANITNTHNASHPATSYRMLALDKTVEEIEAKRAAGKPLTPELKEPAKQ